MDGAPKHPDDIRPALLQRYRTVRQTTEAPAAPLSPEDQQVQSMEDASPTKWHLAHVSWFFETFVLRPYAESYAVFDDTFAYLFNSYYEAAGPRHARPQRGMLTRPSLSRIMAYRAHVDGAIAAFLETAQGNGTGEALERIELGLNHEQQHQELILMDIKHMLSCNPFLFTYSDSHPNVKSNAPALAWSDVEGGIHSVGHDGEGFAFDNEGPRHEVLLQDFQLGSRLTTNREYREFMEDGGYQRPEFWHMDGWAKVNREGWEAPLYWSRRDGDWRVFTLSGERDVDMDAPVCHVSFYEASAYAAWAGKRLPLETEWETAADLNGMRSDADTDGNLLSSGHLHPIAARDTGNPTQMIGDVWEWTASPYTPYPKFRVSAGAIGEYNGKFMVNQMVLRGGSCATPVGHIRHTYRNFFYPHQRWMFSGIRLAA
jgi:ergothioneine biosynthesis protein EgtB